ncbi:hypothetical protein GK047_11990 [Paenibacillus sp. SYP-B3998]|uniref:Uncharacterized protein n=2 Tax=Paenibacillus sp. SYP-B3998 TaxID=2678564 RepID=A0A6G3ZX97_9BACL|nr:hypothetical protein [Paenibacillus sp. SYP-B3998]
MFTSRCHFAMCWTRPYDLLMQDVALKKKGIGTIFDVCVNYYNTKLATDWNGYAVDNVEFYNGRHAVDY